VKANNFTVCLDIRACTRNCPFCISKMTPSLPYKPISGYQYRKAFSFAKTAGANSVLITARGEPLCDVSSIGLIASYANQYEMPCELQTNGDLLNREKISLLNNIDIFAISIDSIEQIEKQKESMLQIVDSNKILRWTVLLHDKTTEWTTYDWIEAAKEIGVRQLSFRKLSAPSNPVSKEPIEWIEKNTKSVDEWLKYFDAFMLNDFPVLRKLSFGPTVIDAYGIALTYFPYCLEEGSETEDFRSLILREDGHMYTSWSSTASVIF
jgi:organic radical activating enzyme